MAPKEALQKKRSVEVSLRLWESGGREPEAQECKESGQGRKGRDPAPETQKKQPCRHLDLSSVKLVADCQLPEGQGICLCCLNCCICDDLLQSQ